MEINSNLFSRYILYQLVSRISSIKRTSSIFAGIAMVHGETHMVLGRIDDRAILLSEFLRVTLMVKEIHDLEDHPSGCKWLITMVSCCPLNGVVFGPLPNGLFMAYKWVLLTTC